MARSILVSSETRYVSPASPVPSLETPEAANKSWGLDFIFYQICSGRLLCVLALLENCTRKRIGFVANLRISGLRVAPKRDTT